MVFTCSVFGCRSNYQKENVAKTVFEFPPADDETFSKWVKFVNRKDFKPTASSRICVDHFEKRYLRFGLTRINLLRKLKPIPTIFGEQVLKSTPVSKLPSVTTTRKPPKQRLSATKEENELQNSDKISSFDQVNESICPREFLFQRFESHVLYYRIFYEEGDDTPYLESIAVDRNLHVKLNYKGCHVPLPAWFKSTRYEFRNRNILQNFVDYMRNMSSKFPHSVLSNIHKLMFYKQQGRPPYSSDVLKFSLIQRYTSRQAYANLLEEFLLPSISFLRKLTAGGIDPLKALKTLLENEKLSKDSVLIVDEMILQKSSDYHGGQMIGQDENGNYYSGILTFMIVGLTKSIPYVVKAVPVVNLKGDLVKEEIEDSLRSITDIGFNIRAVISDNHSTNVLAYSSLLKTNGLDNNTNKISVMYFEGRKIYLMYDSVHLIKNVRNNLLNNKIFIFPPF